MKKIYLLAAAGLMMLSSCDLDINENPNSPSNSDVTADLVFPAIENSIATAVGDQMFNYAGFFVQYWDQMPTANQYNDLAELHLDEGSDLFRRCYQNLFAQALEDVEDVLSKTDNTSDVFAAKVLRAQAFQLLVDNMDQCPYTEALQGSANAMPKWDDGKTVYLGVLSELDEAEANLKGEPMTVTDPLLDKSLNQWKGYANALRLRMYMRLIDGGASEFASKAQALVNAGNFFSGDVAWNVYSDAQGQRNPWGAIFYEGTLAGTKNLCAAYPLVTYYQATSDPRIAYGLEVSSKFNDYVGQLPGSKTLTGDWLGIGSAYNDTYVSNINRVPAKAMPIYLFTQSELQFLIAEVQARFNSNDAAAQAAYEAGVKADFASRGIDGADAFLAANKTSWSAQATDADKLKLLYMQKWVAFFYRNHMEAWSEARRTDVPALSSASAKDIFDDSTVYSAGDFVNPGVNFITGGGLAKRVPYPSNARRYNKNTPAVKLLSDRVFWDVK
ncbi:MAG: SusD/RagB family nutrient-binding outer membrane lipoprotein [Prevotella sp.]|nr:SusD/RagB family nutrient-binding outer membrane lipoprotein [Prevotella sp.]